MDGSVISHTFTYNDGSGSPPTIDVPSANCSGGVCQHVFTTPTSSVPSFYYVSLIYASQCPLLLFPKLWTIMCQDLVMVVVNIVIFLVLFILLLITSITTCTPSGKKTVTAMQVV